MNDVGNRLVSKLSVRGALIACLAFLLSSAQAIADDFIIPSGIVVTTTQTLNGSETGIVEAGGTISTSGDNESGIYAVGNYNTVSNSGTIETIGDKSHGIYAHVSNNNTLSNSGNIETTGFFSAGIYAFYGFNNTLSNSGNIDTSGGNGIYAYGDNNTLINIGTIHVTGGNALAVWAARDNNTVNNSGTIRINGDRSGGIGAYGDNITVSNSGTVIAMGTDSKSFILLFGNNTLNLLQGSVLVGEVNLAGDEYMDTVNLGRGENWAVSFASAGGAPDVLSTRGLPTALLNSGLQVVTYDPSGVTAQGEAFLGLMGAVRDGLHFRLTTGNPTTYAWAQAIGAETRTGEAGVSIGTQDNLQGFMTGVSTSFGPWGRGGLFAGGASSERATGSLSEVVDSDHGFGGAYARLFFDQFFADVILTAGGSTNDSERRIKNNLVSSGIEYARGQYDGWFVSPELTVGAEVPVTPFLKIVPSISGGYSALFLDAYRETGSVGSVAFDGRNLEIWDGRAQVELRVKGEGVTEGWYGALRTGLKGSTETGDGVSGVLASTTPFTVKSPTQDTAAFFGGDILFSPTETIQIFAGGEAAVDGDTTDIQGRAGASIRF